MGKYTDSTGQSYLKILSSFALAALSIQHSNARCERIFSKVNSIKTKTRNHLVTPTITGILLTTECIKGTQEDRCCQTFEPTKEMYSRMAAKNLYSGRIGTEHEESAATENDECSFSIVDF